MTAGGAVAASFLTNYVLSRYGPYKLVNGQVQLKGENDGFVLPLLVDSSGAPNVIGNLIYQAGIPLAGAYVISRFAPQLRSFSAGLLIGGLANAMGLIVQRYALPSSGGSAGSLGAYLDSPPVALPNYSAAQTFGQIPAQTGLFDNRPAFTGDAWSQ